MLAGSGCSAYDATLLDASAELSGAAVRDRDARTRDCDGPCPRSAVGATSVVACSAIGSTEFCFVQNAPCEGPDCPPDQCPTDPNKTQPGQCGCGLADTDADHDGTADCSDGCPQDARKTVAGACGCGVVDQDDDMDGTANCLDGCAHDPNKTAPAACGCGQADNDGDHDATADCIDACPEDTNKVSPGICGCGQSDPADAEAGPIYCAKSQLAHRYSFDGTGAVARDSVGNADGTIYGGKNATLNAGSLTLAGDMGAGCTTEGYVQLPASIWQGMANTTFEAWITWKGKGAFGNAMWQRIFDFGDQTGNAGHGFINVMPQGESGVRTTFTINGSPNEVTVSTTTPLPQNARKHLVVVVNDTSSIMRLYVDGVEQGWVKLPAKLADIKATNLWLGRSQFVDDSEFYGVLHEFRIYKTALAANQVSASFVAGPDYPFAP